MGFGSAAVIESFLHSGSNPSPISLQGTPILLADSTSWTLVVSVLWFVGPYVGQADICSHLPGSRVTEHIVQALQQLGNAN